MREKKIFNTEFAHLPEQDASLDCAEDKDAVVRGEGKRRNPFRKRHNSFLIVPLSVVYVYGGFVGLSGEDVGFADGEAVLWRCALFERAIL